MLSGRMPQQPGALSTIPELSPRTMQDSLEGVAHSTTAECPRTIVILQLVGAIERRSCGVEHVITLHPPSSRSVLPV